jgi:hypothetical protein
MTRALYASLLRLHPPAFRRKFGREMLWIFDEARVSEGAFVPLFDLLISFLRQWLLRSGAWKLLPALIGAVAQVVLGGGAWWLSSSSRGRWPVGPEVTPAMSEILLVTLVAAGTIVTMVSGVAFWVGRFSRQRAAASRRRA